MTTPHRAGACPHRGRASAGPGLAAGDIPVPGNLARGHRRVRGPARQPADVDADVPLWRTVAVAPGHDAAASGTGRQDAWPSWPWSSRVSSLPRASVMRLLAASDIAVEAGGTRHDRGTPVKATKPRSRPGSAGMQSGRPSRASGDLVAGPLPGEDLMVTCCSSPGRAGRLDPTMAPATWKMALSRSPLPRGSGERT